MQICSITLQLVVFLLFYQNYKVACNTIPCTGISLPSYRKLHVISHSCRNVYFHYLFFLHHTITIAFGAFVLYYLAFATTGRTGRGGLHLTEYRVLYPCYSPLSAAGATGFKPATIGTGATAFRAGSVLVYFDLLLYSMGNILQIQLYPDP
mgnify:CR=1 FL=1